ncbi:MAG: M50 family metallopeptidase [Elusimicrobia bacterium]|nr:M50 family metallopeptidase [Candidatus Obscuribacterium magneticum]
MLAVLGVAFAFGVVIFVHEFGHFIVAKKTGVKVERFAFGFGKEVVGFQWGETRYSINWIPLGGYVKMAGEVPEEYEGPVLEGGSAQGSPSIAEDHSRDFLAKPWYLRVPIIVAGPVMNYVLAFFIFFGILVVWGLPIQMNKTDVGEIIAGMPADRAGLKTGDRILRVEGQSVEDFQTIADLIHHRPERPVSLVIHRSGKEVNFNIKTQRDKRTGYGLIGIRPADPVYARKRIGLMESINKSGVQCWNITWLTLSYLGQKIWALEKPDVAGPVGIAQVVAKAVRAGWEDFLYLIGLISVSLGLFNLFPIPLLDGGHVAYNLAEGIRGKPLSQKTISRANTVGMAILLGILTLAFYNDIQRSWMAKEKPPVQQGK